MPENVALAIAVEIADAGDFDQLGRYVGDWYFRHGKPVHEPDLHIARRVSRQRMSPLPSALEVAGSRYPPTRRLVANDGRLTDRPIAVHQPDPDITSGVAPE